MTIIGKNSFQIELLADNRSIIKGILDFSSLLRNLSESIN